MMKKILLFALLGLLAVSCSNDDPTIIEQDIVGTWEAQVISGFTYPVDMPKYIRFDGSSYYSSDSNSTPTENAKSYTIEFKENLNAPKDLYDLEKGFKGDYFITIGGTEYKLTLLADDLDLSSMEESYTAGVISSSGDTTTKAIPTKWQSRPYGRVQTTTP